MFIYSVFMIGYAVGGAHPTFEGSGTANLISAFNALFTLTNVFLTVLVLVLAFKTKDQWFTQKTTESLIEGKISLRTHHGRLYHLYSSFYKLIEAKSKVIADPSTEYPLELQNNEEIIKSLIHQESTQFDRLYSEYVRLSYYAPELEEAFMEYFLSRDKISGTIENYINYSTKSGSIMHQSKQAKFFHLHFHREWYENSVLKNFDKINKFTIKI